jgi:hypothetical protein
MLVETKEAITEFKHDVESLAKYLMDENEGIEPCLMFLTENKGKFASNLCRDIHSLFDGGDRGPFIKAIETIIKKEKPIAIAVLTEAWMVKRKKGEGLTGKVSEQSDRVEIVHIQFETFNNSGFTSFEIMRDKEKPYLVLTEEMDLNKKCDKKEAGQFTNLLKENYDSFTNDLLSVVNSNLN